MRTVIGFLAIILLGVGLYTYKDETVPEVVDSRIMKQSEDVPAKSINKESEEASTESGTYEPYSAEKVKRAKDGAVVLFFHASWCSSCRALDEDIRTSKTLIPKGTTILDVDYDSSIELRKKYGVTYQHTMVQVDTEGELINKWAGSLSLIDLLARIQ